MDVYWFNFKGASPTVSDTNLHNLTVYDMLSLIAGCYSHLSTINTVNRLLNKVITLYLNVVSYLTKQYWTECLFPLLTEKLFYQLKLLYKQKTNKKRLLWVCNVQMESLPEFQWATSFPFLMWAKDFSTNQTFSFLNQNSFGKTQKKNKKSL